MSTNADYPYTSGENGIVRKIQTINIFSFEKRVNKKEVLIQPECTAHPSFIAIARLRRLILLTALT